jgi:hypothetical protein
MLVGLTLPIVLRWHHRMLIAVWNANLLLFFLPGQPPLWVGMAFLSLFISAIARTLRKQNTMIKVPSITYPLLALLTVIVVTMLFSGGIGARAFGSETWGAKRYLSVLGAFAGYFALLAEPLPASQRQLFAGLYFLSGITAVVSDLAYAAGPKFYFLYLFFPPEIAQNQATTQAVLWRFTGIAWTGQALCWFMLLRYGIRGLLDLSHPLRFACFSLFIFGALIGGFRSTLILLLMLMAVQFCLERLFRTGLFPMLGVIIVLVGVFLAGFSDRLPLTVQRAISFLPVKVNPLAKQDAAESLEWRFRVWRMALPDVPKYFFLGKGLTFSAGDLFLTEESVRRGYYSIHETVLVTGTYHNGFLTLIIPFGVFGFIAFLWFCAASLRVLYRNYLYGEEGIKNINNFLLTYFIARLIFFFVFFGHFEMDLVIFIGTVAMSIVVNSGVCSPVPCQVMPSVQSAIRRISPSLLHA